MCMYGFVVELSRGRNTNSVVSMGSSDVVAVVVVAASQFAGYEMSFSTVM